MAVIMFSAIDAFARLFLHRPVPVVRVQAADASTVDCGGPPE